MTTATRPRVKVFATGGSIATSSRHRLDLAAYPDYGVRIPFQQILAEMPEVNDIAQVELEQFRNIGSTNITPQDMLELAQRIQATLRQDPHAAGVVVTHGTNTLEETAYLLHLTVHDPRPIVVVGSMRPPHGMSSDALLNFINAVRAASSPLAAGKGCLIVMNQEINCAREAVKSNTLRLETFAAPHFGLLGYVEANGQVVFYREPARRHTVHSEFDADHVRDLPRVDIVMAYAGADGTAVEAFAAKGARAIVLAGQGQGMGTREQNEALLAAQRKGVIIIQSSRAASGRVSPEAGLRQERGWVAADNLPPSKARILAMLALTRTAEVAEIQRMYGEY